MIKRSPVPLAVFTPRDLILSVRPFGVPGAIRTVTSSPSRVGTFISAPKAASAKVTGSVISKFNSFLEKTGCFTTFTVTNTNVSATNRLLLSCEYTGNGNPVVRVVSVGAGTFDVRVTNADAAAALNAVIKIHFLIVK